MEPLTLILAAILTQTQATPPPPAPPAGTMATGAGRGPHRQGPVTRDGWMAAFDRMDADRDGLVTPEERRAARAAGLQGPGPDGRGAGRRRGRGGHAMIRPNETRDAYLARAAARFDRVDANRDGRIDAAELRGARGRRGAGDAAPPPRP